MMYVTLLHMTCMTISTTPLPILLYTLVFEGFRPKEFGINQLDL